MAQKTRARMIDGAIELLAVGGLEGTSFATVLERTGAPRGSIYHHFPEGKEQLIEAALQVNVDRAVAALDGLAGRPAGEVASTFVAGWRRLLEATDFRAGCALLAVTVEAASPRLRTAVAIGFDRWEAALARNLVAGGLSIDQAPGQAAALLAACEGAVVRSRAARDLAPFDQITGYAVATVDGAATRSAAGERRGG